MKNRLITLLLSLFTLGCSCSTGDTRAVDLRTLEERIEAGDLIFRCGTGFAGRVVTSLDEEGLYSHVGIVVGDREAWQVVHSVPYEPAFEGDYDRVKCEPLRAFVGRYPTAEIGHFRPNVAQESLQRIVQHALRLSKKGIAFDHKYDLNDTTCLYCTEMIDYLFGLEGYTISEGRRTEVSFPSLAGSYIFPSDLTKSTLLTPIY